MTEIFDMTNSNDPAIQGTSGISQGNNELPYDSDWEANQQSKFFDVIFLTLPDFIIIY